MQCSLADVPKEITAFVIMDSFTLNFLKLIAINFLSFKRYTASLIDK